MPMVSQRLLDICKLDNIWVRSLFRSQMIHRIYQSCKALEGITCLRSDASYLLVGDLGGIGRAVASWMVEKGARHLVFLHDLAKHLLKAKL